MKAAWLLAGTLLAGTVGCHVPQPVVPSPPALRSMAKTNFTVVKGPS